MITKFLLKTEEFNFLFLTDEKGMPLAIIDMDSYYKMTPKNVTTKGSSYYITTSSLMDINNQEILQVTLEADVLYCDGYIADYGEILGRAIPYAGLTPYEQMVKELSVNRSLSYSVRTDEEVAQEVESLLNSMTLEEKIGQMSQSVGEDVSEIGEQIEGKSMIEQIKASEIGSVIYVGYSPENIFAFQKHAVEDSRLGIPLLVCQDVVHGFQTIFPIPLAQSCSFDSDLVEKCAEIAAKEASSAGIMCAYAPMLDLSRDPRWGRGCESIGEDPYLGSVMAEAIVKGYQGNSLGNLETVAACLKHFIGYSACEGGRDYNTVEISEHTLYNMYLPAFRAGIDAGASMVMSSFNVMNGIPVTANRKILKDLLRTELGFQGIVITDFAGVQEIGIHGCFENHEEITKKTVEASVDIEMATSYFNSYLKKMIIEKVISEELINQAVRRILTLKYKLGIMDDPYRYIQPTKAEQIVYCKEHLEIAKKMAVESIVLLKNEGVLPFSTSKKVALIGPCADTKDMLGAWQFSEYLEQCITLKEGMERQGFRVNYTKGCEISQELPNGIQQAVKVAERSDVIVLAVGESSAMSGEAASRLDITVSKYQIKLAEMLKKTGKPLIVTLTNGRPLLLNWFTEYADAILETWFLGSMAGDAIAEILSGKCAPSGKLCMSFPENIGQIPIYYNYYNTGRPYKGDNNRFTSRYLDGSNNSQYAFGYGLTYSDFSFSDMYIDKKEMNKNDFMKASVWVKNNSKVEGTEVVQLYLRDVSASVVRPVKELKDFCRVTLAPGEKRKVYFIISEEKLKFYNQEKEFKAEKGIFEIMIGNSSRDIDLLKDSFRLLE